MSDTFSLPPQFSQYLAELPNHKDTLFAVIEETFASRTNYVAVMEYIELSGGKDVGPIFWCLAQYILVEKDGRIAIYATSQHTEDALKALVPQLQSLPSPDSRADSEIWQHALTIGREITSIRHNSFTAPHTTNQSIMHAYISYPPLHHLSIVLDTLVSRAVLPILHGFSEVRADMAIDRLDVDACITGPSLDKITQLSPRYKTAYEDALRQTFDNVQFADRKHYCNHLINFFTLPVPESLSTAQKLAYKGQLLQYMSRVARPAGAYFDNFAFFQRNVTALLSSARATASSCF